MSRPKNIEAIARHRELNGFDVIQELKDIFRRALDHPNKCRVVLHGPDTLFISRFPPAVDFLIENGFVIAEVGKDTVLELPVVHDEDSADWYLFKREMVAALSLLQWASDCNTSVITLKLSAVSVKEDRALSAPFRLVAIVRWLDELGNRKEEVCESEDYHSNEAGSPTSINANFINSTTPSSTPQKNGQRGGEEGEKLQVTRFSSVVEIFGTKCDQPCTVEVQLVRKRAIIHDKIKGVGHLTYCNSVVGKKVVWLVDPDVVATLPSPPTQPHDGSTSITYRLQQQEDTVSSSVVGGGGLPLGVKTPKEKSILGSVVVELESVRHRCAAAAKSLFLAGGGGAGSESREGQQSREEGGEDDDAGGGGGSTSTENKQQRTGSNDGDDATAATDDAATMDNNKYYWVERPTPPPMDEGRKYDDDAYY